MLTPYNVTDKVRLKPAPEFESYPDGYTGVVKEVMWEQNTPIYVVVIDPGFELPFKTVEVTEDNILGFHSLTLN